MATPKLLHLRSQTKGALPSAAAIVVGQIGVNYNAADPFLCIKDSNGVVRRLDSTPIGTIAPASPIKGQLWVDNTGAAPVLKIYTGTAWTTVDTVSPLATTALAGLAQLATAADVTAGASDRVVTADQLKTTNDRITTAAAGGLTGVSGTAPITASVSSGSATVSITAATTAAAGSMSAADKAKLDGIASGAEVNVQPDWTQADNTKDDYIKNKPTSFPPPVATAAVLGGVKAGTGVTVAADGTLSVSLSGGMIYKGTTDPTTAPPAAPTKGDVWIASKGGAYDAGWGLTGTATEGELLIWEGTKWDAVGQSTPAVKPSWTAAAGAADEILNKPGDASTSTAGLMTAADKTKLDGIAAGAQVNVKPDWSAAAGNAAEILNKPTIPTVVDATATVKGIVRLADAAAITAGTAGRVVDAAQLKVVNDAIATATGGGITGITGTAPVKVTGAGATRNVEVDPASTTAAGLMSAADKTKLNGMTAGAEPNVQPDWNEADNTSDAFIRNKPTMPAAYVLPAATTTTLGGVSVGSGLTVNGTGELSATYSYTLPAATAAALGGIKVGGGLTVAADGTLAVASTGALNFKGSKKPSDTAPTAPAKGDVYVMSVAGQMDASWTPLGSTPVSLHEVVAWDGTDWVLLGSAASTSVNAISAAAPLSATGTSNVALSIADATEVVKGVLRLATDAEATGGTLTSVAINAKQLHARIPDGTKDAEYLGWDQTTSRWVAADTLVGGVY